MKRTVWIIGAALLLTGCGNCNILGGGTLPARCEAGLAAGAVVLAPVAIPMAIADDAKARKAAPRQSKRPARIERPTDPRARKIYEAAGVEFDD